MSTVRVVSRNCPECGQVMDARAGLGLFVCGGCPTAVDVSLGEGQRLLTCRPDDEAGDLRLPFFLFHVDDGRGRRGHWIPAFRAGSPEGHVMNLGETLTTKYDPHLVSAPLGAPVGRDRREAEGLLRTRLKAELSFALPTPRLVSLSCRVEGARVHEPVSGWKWRLEHVWPSSAGGSEPPVESSATVRRRLADRDARHAREQGAFRSFDWIRKFMAE